MIAINQELSDNFNGKYDEDCPLECSSSFFKLSQSFKSFPTTSHAKYLLKHYELFNRSFDLNRTLTIDDISKSIARIRIHPYDTKYMIVTEMEAITLINLISNIGGLLGLFMGMSLLSFAEIFDIFFIVLLESWTKKREKHNITF